MKASTSNRRRSDLRVATSRTTESWCDHRFSAAKKSITAVNVGWARSWRRCETRRGSIRRGVHTPTRELPLWYHLPRACCDTGYLRLAPRQALRLHRSPWTMYRSTSSRARSSASSARTARVRRRRWNASQGHRHPDGGTISVLGLDPRRDANALRQRIGVQHQDAHLQKRIKVWEAVDLWSSLYSRVVDTDRAARPGSGSRPSATPGS